MSSKEMSFTFFLFFEAGERMTTRLVVLVRKLLDRFCELFDRVDLKQPIEAILLVLRQFVVRLQLQVLYQLLRELFLLLVHHHR